MRNSLSERLQKEMFATDEATDESEAQRLCQTGEYDVAIVGSDIECRDLPMPKIVVADHPTLDNAIAALRAGAIDYLKMPVDMNMLLERVRSIASDDIQPTPRCHRHTLVARTVPRSP